MLDALQPAVLCDDKLVVEVTVRKLWCLTKLEEKTEIELTALE